MKLIKFTSILISAFVIVIIGAIVLVSEKDKKIKKLQDLNSTYYSQVNALNNYKKEYDTQVANIIEQNKNQMTTAKAQYDTLLKDQPKLIAQHTSTATQQVTITPKAPSNSSNQKTQQVTVQKPKPSTSTKSS